MLHLVWGGSERTGRPEERRDKVTFSPTPKLSLLHGCLQWGHLPSFHSHQPSPKATDKGMLETKRRTQEICV